MDTSKFFKKSKLSTTNIIIIGFAGIILLGGFLLMLPFSSADGTYTPFVDALFTSGTSVCVTGLTTLVTATHWSLTGKIIILVLIQLGGLGVVCCGILIMVAVGKKITMKERLLIQESYGLETNKGLVTLIIQIFKWSVLIEFIGAIIMSPVFIPEYGILKGIFYSIFHSVSAFCNAGLDLIGDFSYIPYNNNPIILITTMCLIVFGGIGFIVWKDVSRVIRDLKNTPRIREHLFKKLSLHSKIAITTTVFLIISGALLVFIFEFTNDKTLANMSTPFKVMNSFFQSITSRTAGFASIPQVGFRDATTIIVMILMFIGGSPTGTAGGMKTTTIAMLMAMMISVIKGKRDTEIFHRRIATDNIKTGFAVVIIGCIFLITGLLLLSITENLPLKDLAFEAVSAISTTGLSRGITSSLTSFGKVIIIIMMFVGRIGPITMAVAFTLKTSKTNNMHELPKKRIIVG